MSIDTAAATTYAKALFAAVGVDELGAVDAELAALREAFERDPVLWEQLLSPNLSLDQQKGALDAAAASSSTLTRNFLRLIVDKRRLDILLAVIITFHELVQAEQREIDVRVTTAVEMPEELRSKLEARLSETTGGTVVLHASIDPNIIGGLVIRHGDTLIDNSIRGRLVRLRQHIASTRNTRNDS